MYALLAFIICIIADLSGKYWYIWEQLSSLTRNNSWTKQGKTGGIGK